MSDVGIDEPQSIVRRLVRLAWPMVLYGLVQAFVTANDALLLGTAGSAAIASAGAAGAVVMVITFFFSGLGGTGGQILVSRHWGSGDKDAAGVVTERALLLVVVLALPLLVAAAVAATPLLDAIGGTAVDTGLAAAMLHICLPGALAACVGGVLRGYATGIGATRVVMVASLTASVVDVGLSVALLLAGMGPLAVSVGTACGMIASAGVLAGWVARRRRAGEPAPSVLASRRHRWRSTAEVWRVGWPEALLGAFSAGAGIVVTVLMSRSAPSQLAAARVIEATTTLTWTVLNGIGAAGLTLLGQALGASSPSAYRRVLRAMLIVGGCAAALLLAGGPLLTGAYLGTSFDDEVIRAARPVLLLAWAQVCWILLSTLLLGICRSHKDTVASLRASLAAEYLVFLPVGWLVCRVLDLGVTGLFLAHHAFWLAFCAVLAVPAIRHVRRQDP
ncbi:MAG: MATE family efflux transporter [Arachnia sp.]